MYVSLYISSNCFLESIDRCAMPKSVYVLKHICLQLFILPQHLIGDWIVVDFILLFVTGKQVYLYSLLLAIGFRNISLTIFTIYSKALNNLFLLISWLNHNIGYYRIFDIPLKTLIAIQIHAWLLFLTLLIL